MFLYFYNNKSLIFIYRNKRRKMKVIKSNFKNNRGKLYYCINLFFKKSIVLLYWINYAYKVFT